MYCYRHASSNKSTYKAYNIHIVNSQASCAQVFKIGMYIELVYDGPIIDSH